MPCRNGRRFTSSALIYTLVVLKRARGQTGYQPVFEDWLFSVILPLAAYTAILLAAWRLPANPTWLLFVIGGAALLVLFTAFTTPGIR